VRIYEVFLKKDGKDGFRHVGALEAPDNEFALLLARECYCRRGEGNELWLVDRAHVVKASADLLEPNQDKPHRASDGSVIAERRRRLRTAGATEVDAE
jgi:ring-1,2-phenylacetyl-CoA epoxidase subunit PaaB